MSQHLGDLSHPRALAAFVRTLDDLPQLFRARPRWIAYDPHPAYFGSRKAVELARQTGWRTIAVQHHHAHAGALMAEHGLRGPILAVVCDGVGYGPDGTSWGGEFLRCDLVSYQRVGHFVPLRLPGGDQASLETDRCGLALLHQALGDQFDSHPAATRLIPDLNRLSMLSQMIRRDIALKSSGVGRVFDGVAALLGLCDRNQYEAQAAMRLEARAADHVVDWPIEHSAADGVISISPLILELLRRRRGAASTQQCAAYFHQWMAAAISAAAVGLARRLGLSVVGLTGGCFCNVRLLNEVSARIERAGLRTLRHRDYSPNDSAISLGQAAVASAILAGERKGA